MKKLFLFACLLAVLAGCSKKDEPSKVGLTDICGNGYPIVTIGSQTWMAENLRCAKYDTESEAYKAGQKEVSTSDSWPYTPYYSDASDKTKWSTGVGDYSGNLTNAQVAKLGFLYNWAAAVGIADGQQQKEAFTGNRQGICPNGWHLPSKAEWDALKTFIEVTQGKGTNSAGKHLKTTSGWFNNANGTDTYGFAALPSGLNSEPVGIAYAGTTGSFWSSTPFKEYKYFAYFGDLSFEDDNFSVFYYEKTYGRSVRCIKN